MERIKRYCNAVPPTVEFAIVVALAFGMPILGSVLTFAIGGQEGSISQDGLQSLIIHEAIVFVALASFLILRGWSAPRIGLVPSLKNSAIGLALAFIGWQLSGFAVLVVGSFLPDVMAEARAPSFVSPGFAVSTVLLASAVNGFFEEVFVAGYIITALKERRGFWFAINVSVAIRLSYHLYQGPVGVAGIVPIGLLFGYFYARTGQLWPLVFAHALIDALALLQFA